MNAALGAVAALLGAAIAGTVLGHAVAYGRAAAHRRRHAAPCAFGDDDAPPRLARALGALGAFVRECAASARLLLMLPLALRREPAGPPGPRPVVLVHGDARHAASFLPLARRLRRDGWTELHRLRHGPLDDLARRAARLGALIDGIRARRPALAVDVVAHGVGGLVARAYVASRGVRCGIARLITLGTPHRGRAAARRLPGAAGGDPVPALVDCTAIYSVDDATILPAEDAYYPGAFNVRLRGLGHASLLFSSRVHDLVRENLAAPLGEAGAPPPDGAWTPRP